MNQMGTLQGLLSRWGSTPTQGYDFEKGIGTAPVNLNPAGPLGALSTRKPQFGMPQTQPGLQGILSKLLASKGYGQTGITGGTLPGGLLSPAQKLYGLSGQPPIYGAQNNTLQQQPYAKTGISQWYSPPPKTYNTGWLTNTK